MLSDFHGIFPCSSSTRFTVCSNYSQLRFSDQEFDLLANPISQQQLDTSVKMCRIHTILFDCGKHVGSNIRKACERFNDEDNLCKALTTSISIEGTCPKCHQLGDVLEPITGQSTLKLAGLRCSSGKSDDSHSDREDSEDSYYSSDDDDGSHYGSDYSEDFDPNKFHVISPTHEDLPTDGVEVIEIHLCDADVATREASSRVKEELGDSKDKGKAKERKRRGNERKASDHRTSQRLRPLSKGT